MTESKAAKAETKPADTSATKSAAEGETLPDAAAPDEAAAEETEDLGPFTDAATPVGAAAEKAVEKIDTTVDFPTTDAFAEIEGDVVVSVRQHNQRNVVSVSPAGWVGNGMDFAPYQAKLLHKALGRVIKKIK